jgi:DNA polymerase-1
MEKKLFLLDGMALVYRAHFALITRPILTSTGVNTSALYGFTQTLMEILKNQQPTHMAVAFDTEAPTHRHTEYAEYKATRQVMPEDLSEALPHVRRMIEAFNVAVLTCDGFEADDIIGTLVQRAEKEGFQSFMVTPDKDFGQLITDKVLMYKPSRMGDGVEVLGLPEIKARWGIERPEQVVDVLALMGDSSDNVPGVPGIGEKTAMKLIGQFGSVENLLARTAELTGKLKERIETNKEAAVLSKRLVTILRNAPCDFDLEDLKVKPLDEAKVKDLLMEFEFNSIGKRLFGEEFKAGRGGSQRSEAGGQRSEVRGQKAEVGGQSSEGRGQKVAVSENLEFVLTLEAEGEGVVNEEASASVTIPANQKTIAEVGHDYRLIAYAAGRKQLVAELRAQKAFCFDTKTTSLDAKGARIVGVAFSFAAHKGYYVPMPQDEAGAKAVLEELRPALEDESIEKVGHNLKFDLSVLRWQEISVKGKLFDTMVAHSLIEPDMRHGMDYMSEVYLGYTPIALGKLMGGGNMDQLNMADVPVEKVAEYAAEDADVTWQLRAALEPLLKEKGQERVFYEIESPLIPVLVEMEYEGIKLDAGALAEFGAQLGKEIAELEGTICKLAGTTFNLNSPRQLGQILFDVMKICEKPKKTRTGQYVTDEQTLLQLAPEHEIVRRLLEHRTASKLKSTYADALPTAIWPKTGRVHTTYNQVMTATGRLNSQDPNLQNIPIRSERGQEIRKAFVPRGKGYRLLSADYSQIELRIIAALSKEPALLEAFRSGEDIHTATAARVFGVLPGLVTAEMRRKAKMVNFGIAYGISAFGLSQRLGIPRREAAEIIQNYFKQFPGIRKFMDDTIVFARTNGYVETVTGRRRYLRDIRSANNTVRGSAERNAINAPIQGTAADMIKLAMIHIQRELESRKLKTRMLLQVHDELVFDLYEPEEKEVRAMVEEKMKAAIPLEVTMAVETGVGENWLEAH